MFQAQPGKRRGLPAFSVLAMGGMLARV